MVCSELRFVQQGAAALECGGSDPSISEAEPLIGLDLRRQQQAWSGD
jgi:hypothetical protein